MLTIFYPPKMDRLPQSEKDSKDLPRHTTIATHFQCPECGQDGRLRKKTIGIRPKSTSNLKTENEWEDGEVVYSKKIQRTSRSHPNKWISFVNSLIGKWINQRDFGQSIKDYAINLATLRRVMLLVAQKYPSMSSQINEWILSFQVFRVGLDSIVDNRYDRSLFEWADISQTALEEGIGAAAKKHSGFRGIRLSRNHIKDMIPVGTKFAMAFPLALRDLNLLSMRISQVIFNDPELLEAYNRAEDDIRKWGLSSSSSVVSTDTRSEIEGKRRTREYRYPYFYVRHYDEANTKSKNGMEPSTLVG